MSAGLPTTPPSAFSGAVVFGSLPTISSRASKGSATLTDGETCCFRPEPLGSREEFREVVEELDCATFSEEDRGLKPGREEVPGAR